MRTTEPLTIVIPVHNEGANFPVFWSDMCARLPVPFVAIVVYDSDDDDTLPVLSQIKDSRKQKLCVLKNAYGRGVVGAIKTGFENAGPGPVVVLMADLSDDLDTIPSMLALYGQGYDLVAGSRHMKGGRLMGGPWLKKTLSRLAGISLYWFRGLPTHDATNAFKIYDRDMLRTIQVESRGGFELSLEITVKAFLAGFRMTETPTTWRDRTAGHSHFKLWQWLPLYLGWYLHAFRARRNRVRSPLPDSVDSARPVA